VGVVVPIIIRKKTINMKASKSYLPLEIPLGVNGAALAAREDMVEFDMLPARAVGVNEGESTFRVFLGLYGFKKSATTLT
jgi:hypothetical protein